MEDEKQKYIVEPLKKGWHFPGLEQLSLVLKLLQLSTLWFMSKSVAHLGHYRIIKVLYIFPFHFYFKKKKKKNELTPFLFCLYFGGYFSIFGIEDYLWNILFLFKWYEDFKTLILILKSPIRILKQDFTFWNQNENINLSA